jgi:hypothetical protein
LWALSALLLKFSPGVFAEIHRDDAPHFIEAGLKNATATDTGYNTGGTITVGGFTMQVPKNLQVQFPAAWVPCKEFVESHTDFLGFEPLIIGNTVLGVLL